MVGIMMMKVMKGKGGERESGDEVDTDWTARRRR